MNSGKDHKMLALLVFGPLAAILILEAIHQFHTLLTVDRLAGLSGIVFGVFALTTRTRRIGEVVEFNKKFGGPSEASKTIRALSILVPLFFIVLGTSALFGWTHLNRG